MLAAALVEEPGTSANVSGGSGGGGTLESTHTGTTGSSGTNTA